MTAKFVNTMAFLIACLASSAPNIVEAELTGTDRSTFIEGFVRGCIVSGDSAAIIAQFDGGNRETSRYCNCVAQVYAQNLNKGDTPQNMSARRLNAIEDGSREYCLNYVFGQ